MADDYRLEDLGDKRILHLGNHKWETHYSTRVVNALISRKGAKRATAFLGHKEKRQRFLSPLFNYLQSKGSGGLKVLEVGCASGAMTECLNDQPFIQEVFTYDVDSAMVQITRMNCEDLHLDKVRRVDLLTTAQTQDLPYQDGYFDVIIVLAVVEHLPVHDRYRFVDQYYRKCAPGGLVCFFDTPNRLWPIESHSTGLPFIQFFSPEFAYCYGRLLGKLKDASFPDFVRAGTGWRNATYEELLPKHLTLQIRDISAEAGYPPHFECKGFHLRNLLRYSLFLPYKIISRICGVPISLFLPSLDVVFQVQHNYESDDNFNSESM